MSETFSGTVDVTRNSGSVRTVRLDGNNGNLDLGGDGQDGDLIIRDSAGNVRFNLNGQNMDFEVRGSDGTRIIRIGPDGNITIGGGGHDGDFLINRGDGTRVGHLDGNQANLWLGGSGTDGDIVLFPSGVPHSNDTSQSTIHLDGNAGDIILRNADCAEDFAVADLDVVPGAVMAIDESGKLRMSNTAYDRRVAGVISGAGHYKPGIVLDRQPELKNRHPLAMVGKVMCLADASNEAIEVGDLLTTSARRGHAQRAADPGRAFGAVIGKALGSLDRETGMVPVLVGLQ